MRFQVGDKVLVTAGKDKGKKSEIVKVLPQKDRVVVKDVNMYTRHIKKQQGRSGEKVSRERSLPTANIAIINGKGDPDRITIKVLKDGKKERVFAKTGQTIESKKIVKKAAKK